MKEVDATIAREYLVNTPAFLGRGAAGYSVWYFGEDDYSIQHDQLLQNGGDVLNKYLVDKQDAPWLRRVLRVLILMFLLTAGVLSYVFTGDRGTLIRNSLVVVEASYDDFAWRPDAPPPGFRNEPSTTPGPFHAVADSLLAGVSSSDSFGIQEARLLVEWLHRTPTDERPIRGNLLNTYRSIVDDGYGYCADYIRTSMAILHAMDIPVRHWGMGFGDMGSGHAFLEVFLDDEDDWVFLDPYFAFWVSAPGDRRPLSAHEFRDSLLDETSPDPVVEMIGEGISSFPDAEAILTYYRSAAEFFYMFWGNNVFEMDAHPVLVRLSSISRSVELLAAMAFGIYPVIRPLPMASAAHEAAVQEMRRIRLVLIASAVVLALSGLWVSRELWRRWLKAQSGRSVVS